MTLFLLFNSFLRKKLIKKISKALVSHQINTRNRSMNGLAEAVKKAKKSKPISLAKGLPF